MSWRWRSLRLNRIVLMNPSAQFGQEELRLSMGTLTTAILMVQFVAFFGSHLFNALAKLVGAIVPARETKHPKTTALTETLDAADKMLFGPLLALLAKPYGRDELARKLTEVLRP